MTIHYTTSGRTVTAWIEREGKRVAEGTGNSLEMAIGRLVFDLAQRDDPKAEPRIRILEE